MHHLSITLAVAACLGVPALAQQPPLIDREIFFDDPEISGAQLSPDGKYISFLKPWNKTRNIWVKRAEEPFNAAKLVTTETKRPIQGYFWSRDGKYILYVQDQGGDENFNVYAVDPAAKPDQGKEAPPARNITEAKGARTFIYAVPKSDPDAIYVGLNDRDKAWHDLYKVGISTGERTLLRKNTDRVVGWVFDTKDQLRLAARSADNGDTEILRVDTDGFKKIYSCSVFETCVPVAFHKDNQRVYLMTNKGDASNFIELALMDPATGNTTTVESDPLKRVDLGSPIISDKTHELIGTVYEDDRQRLYFRDKSFEADFNRIKKHVGDKELRPVSSTADERLWLFAASSDTEPGETYLFDRQTKKITLQYRVREKLPRQHMATMKALRYESSDGWEISAYLTLPKGVEPKNLPLIIVPHGGPWARSSWGYSGMAQFLANRGYAVLQPNFRGSTGYGKKFLNGGNIQWGRKMQDDLTWGVKSMVAKGIADPKRIGIMGGSYGGYATLAGVAFTPDVYAAGVSIVGPSNLITLLESIPPYWEAARTMFHKRMGDPSTPEGRKQLEAMSPLFSAAKIKSPLLIVQGANDPRVAKAESDQIVIALRDRKFPVEYIVAPDEGHGFARPVNSMAMYAAAETFLARHLGGRYQEGMTPEVTARLREITVDPATVQLAKKVDAGAVGVPKVAAALTPGTYNYAAKIQIAGQSMDLKTSTIIAQDGNTWKITDKASTPMGEIVDEAVLDGKTLTLMKRNVKQGPITIDMEVKGTKLVGSMTMQGSPKPIDVELGGPLFADAAGASHSVAALPLAEGYTTTYRTFDVQKQKPKLMSLKVDGTESVTVPAGTFEAYRVVITAADNSAEKMTLWVAKDSRKPVKSSAVMPQMNGATMTTELQ